MSKLPFEKELKEALNKPTLTQRETALTALVEKLQGALVDSNYDKLMYEQWYEETVEDVRRLVADLEDSENEIDSLESEISDLEDKLDEAFDDLAMAEEDHKSLYDDYISLQEMYEDLSETLDVYA
jgi:chromosome segregation ATPase